MTPDETKIEVVPITEEHHHHLVLDNEYVRVFHVEVAPHAETRYHQHDMDYIFVTLGDSQVESVRVGEKPVKLELKDGDTRFTKGGFVHKAVNLSDKPFVNVTVELKKKIAEFEDCSGQERCNREIRVGGKKIGEESTLFGDAHKAFGQGFSVVRYEVQANSPFEKDVPCAGMGCKMKLLIVPLTSLTLVIDGHSQGVEAGQSVFGTPELHYKVVNRTSSSAWIAINF